MLRHVRHRSSSLVLSVLMLVAMGLSTWSSARCRVDTSMPECCCCEQDLSAPSVASECCTGTESPRAARSTRLTNGESHGDSPRIAPPPLVASFDAPPPDVARLSWDAVPTAHTGLGPPILQITGALLI